MDISIENPHPDQFPQLKREPVQNSMFMKINHELSLFGADHGYNIHRLTALCGEVLGATCSLYNCLEGGLLCSLASWKPPPNYNPKDTPEGHICYDVIRSASDQVFVIRDLQKSKYAKTDPNVQKYGLKTYIGKAVKFDGVYVGSLCAVYQVDFIPSEEQEHFLSLFALLIGIEEDRRIEYDNFLHAESRFQALLENQVEAVCRWTPELVLTFTNSHYDELFGYKEKILVGKRWIEFVPEDKRTMTEDFYSELMENPKVVSYEHDIVRADGEIRLFHRMDIPLVDKEGKVIEFQSIGRDITGTRVVQTV